MEVKEQEASTPGAESGAFRLDGHYLRQQASQAVRIFIAPFAGLGVSTGEPQVKALAPKKRLSKIKYKPVVAKRSARRKRKTA